MAATRPPVARCCDDGAVVTAFTGALVGVLAMGGVLAAMSGLRRVEVVEQATVSKRQERTQPLDWAVIGRRGAVAVVVGAVLWFLTGWPMAGATGAGISLVVPMLREAQRERARQLNRAEDLARWCEMVRDTIRAGNGLKASIDATAQPRVSGATIRVPVRVLSDRCEHMSVSDALRLFADDVGDAICDQIVTSLIMVEEKGGKQLVPVLTEIVDSVRRRASMRRRVETGRARTYSATRSMVAMTIGLALLATMFGGSFMDPFNTVAVIFIGGVWSLIPMSRPEPEPRLLRDLQRPTTRERV